MASSVEEPELADSWQGHLRQMDSRRASGAVNVKTEASTSCRSATFLAVVCSSTKLLSSSRQNSHSCVPDRQEGGNHPFTDRLGQASTPWSHFKPDGDDSVNGVDPVGDISFVEVIKISPQEKAEQLRSRFQKLEAVHNRLQTLVEHLFADVLLHVHTDADDWSKSRCRCLRSS